MTDLLAVTGKPVAHSLSPEIFLSLFRETGRDGIYTRLAADSAREALETAREIGIRGLNVTSPFKEEMAALVDRRDEPASRIGAVNCLRLEPGAAEGYNTDYMGVIGTLGSLGLAPAGLSALILGAGGAARAAAYGLVTAGASKVVLAGRTPEKTEAAARSLGCEAARLADAGELLGGVDVCVSCLPFPASRILGEPRAGGRPVIDAHYATAPAGPSDAGSPHPTALRWLFHQAVPSFEIMTGTAIDDGRRRRVWDEFASRRAPAGRHIALVGFMGAGKTTVGRKLAELMGRPFIDTDHDIESAAGSSVPTIFARRGEAAFRDLERAAVAEAVRADRRKSVIAVGGGAVLDPANRRLLSENCRTVWLWVPAGTAVSRIDVATRPVLDPGGPLASATGTLAARLPLYAAASALIVNASKNNAHKIAERIKDEMGQTH